MYCGLFPEGNRGKIMNKATASTLSGCVVWILSIGLIASCILPVFFLIGSITSFSQLAIKTTGNLICPAGTSPESYSYETTTTDEFGNAEPATGVELHCLDQNGLIMKKDPVLYSFLWTGSFALVGLIVSGFLAFALAAPIGMLIGRFLNRTRKQNIASTIEPH